MAGIEVKAVSNRRDRQRFLGFPWRLYRDDANWIPPLRANQRELVGYKRHPFYDAAEVCTFLATHEGEACGRVAAIINHAHNRKYAQDPRGFLGFFECVDDTEVANALLSARATGWQKEA